MTGVQFLVLSAIAVLLLYVPIAGKYFRLLNTLLHEIGHVLASLLSGGGIYHVKLFQDTSGVAYVTSSNRFSLAFIAFAGYPFASFMAFAAFWSAFNGYIEWVYWGLTSILIVSLVFWVRNWFGFVWLTGFLVGTGFVYLYAPAAVQLNYIYLITAVLLIESVRSSWVILHLSIVNPHQAGDATALKKSTWISSRVWGLLFFAQSLYFSGYLVAALLFHL